VRPACFACGSLRPWSTASAWVKRALSLDSGQVYVLKLSCQEEFKIHVGPREIKCYRIAEVGTSVLELARGDGRFILNPAVEFLVS
jgi:hypothetical protein